MYRVITKWIYGALTIFNGFGCNFTNCHFAIDTCTIWGQEKNFRMFFPSSSGQSDPLRLNLLKKIKKKERTNVLKALFTLQFYRRI